MTAAVVTRTTHQDCDLALDGCTPEPLLAYLKGLGVLRLVATQADPQARGHWHDSSLHLISALDAEALQRFFLTTYAPTPILSPWNSASGLDGDMESTPGRIVARISASTDPRLRAFRAAIAVAQRIVHETCGILNEKTRKMEVLRRCRNELPNEALVWLDAAAVLTSDGPRYPPLLGTGGNDGRLEFSVNYMDRLADVLPAAFTAPNNGPRKRRTDEQGHSRTHRWLQAALFGGSGAPLIEKAVGQFHPGGVGGPNASTGFEAGSLVNPWDLVLALEGVLFFAAAAVRRFTTEGGTIAATPFTVRSSAVGYTSAGTDDEGGSRGELWLPLWERPTGAAELAHLFSEGRATVGRRRAVTGVDFARAIASLGVDRGVSGFIRYGFLQRSGKAYLASPLGRLPARRVPVKGIDLLSDIDSWLDTWRRVADTEKVRRYTAAVRDVEQAIFDLAAGGGHHEGRSLLQVLAAVGRAAKAFAGLATVQHQRGKKVVHRALQGLSPYWLERCEDAPELRLAAALANLGHGSPIGPLRQNLEPVEYSSGRWTWADQTGPAVVWGDAPLPVNLARILERRCVDARRLGVTPLPLAGGCPVGLGDIDLFLHGAVDEAIIADLTWALCGLTGVSPSTPWRSRGQPATLPRAYALLKLLFWPGEVRDRVVRDEPALLPLLRVGRVSQACAKAARRLRASDLIPLADDYVVSPQAAQRLAAGLLFPITPDAFTHCMRLVLAEPSDTTHL
jgi:CRISPR-associated protein Csx17